MATSPIGSGLDIPSLVSQLVASARAPTEKRITGAGAAATAKLSAVGQIKSAMTALQTALKSVADKAGTPAYKATTAAEAGFAATATSKAVAGSYTVEVVRLATAQKLASGAFADEAVVGAGTLTIGHGQDASVSVQIEADATLDEVAAAINRAAGGKGVVASVVVSGQGRHLVLTAAGTGAGNALSLSASGDGPQALVAGMSEQVAAQDALVRVDGFERSAGSNSIGDIVPGVVLNLTKAAEGTTHTLTVASDSAPLKTSLTAFASAYNAAVGALRSASSYDSTTRTASALTGDSLVRSLQQQLRDHVSANVAQLKALGIALDRDGTMSFDPAALDDTLAADPGAAAAMFGKDGRYGAAMKRLLDSHLDSTDGTLAQRTDSLNKQIEDLEGQLDDLDLRMRRLSDMYTAQFTAMETMIAQLQSSTSSLSSLLASSRNGG